MVIHPIRARELSPEVAEVAETLVAYGGPFEGYSALEVALFAQVGEFITFEAGESLVEQFHPARSFYFLLEGEVEFSLALESLGQRLTVGLAQRPWSPIGWSSFRSPHRYATSVGAKTRVKVLHFNVKQIEELQVLAPDLAALFFRHILEGAQALLRDAHESLVRYMTSRGTISSSLPFSAGRGLTSREDIVTNAAPPPQQTLARAFVFDEMSPEARVTLMQSAQVRYFVSGEVLAEQGVVFPSLLVLASGKVSRVYRSEAGDITLTQFNQEGDLLSMDAVGLELSTDAALVGLRDGAVYQIPRSAFTLLSREHPRDAIVLLQASLAHLGHRLKQVRTSIVSEAFDAEILAVEALIEQSRTELGISSSLHKVPHLLQSTLTLEDALKIVDRAVEGGNQVEKKLGKI
ncbi:MAG: cyclic nucleotide-binding domain-containing protein, partial [Polyangiaceae bacterium]|nr:cyclic nucleotide-binding domain-containing protein [Polyangiaceae bacterium]